MMTVALMLIFIPISGQIEGFIEKPWISIFPGVGFLIAGLIGGLLTDDDYRKAIVMVAVSYLLIGSVTALSIRISCQLECVLFNLTLLGIPIGIVLSAIGLILGFYMRRRVVNTDD